MTEILYQKLNDENIEIVYQSLLILCNISADLSHKSFVMNPFFLKSIKSLLVRFPKIILIINFF